MLAEQVLVLLHHPRTGRRLIWSYKVDLAVGGALLVELAGRRRIELTEPSRLTRNRTVVPVDPAPTGDDVLDEALRRIAARRSARARVVLSMIAKGVRGRLLERLAGQGVLRSERTKLLGIVPVRVWPAVDVRHTEELTRGLRHVLVDQRPPTPHEAALISLLHTVGGTARVLGGAGLDRREMERRAEAIAGGDAAADVVHQALKAAAF